MRERSLPPWADPRAHAILWAATSVAAAIVAVTPGLPSAIRALLGFRFDAETGSLREAGDIAGTNLRVVGGILLAAWLSGHFVALRRALDVWVAATIALNAIAVGCAVGAYGTRAIPWLMHLPLEWTALGAAASQYVSTRRSHEPVGLTTTAVISSAALVSAALIESYAAPR